MQPNSTECRDLINYVLTEMYPHLNHMPFPPPISAYSLDEISMGDSPSEVPPLTADLSIKIGPITLHTPIFSAAMDTVSGPELCIALAETGGCGILYRTKNQDLQMEWLKKVLSHEWCIVRNPLSLLPTDTIDKAKDIQTESGFSTIPIIDESNILKGILFTGTINFEGHEQDAVSRWMKPISKLTTKSPETPFSVIRSFITGPRTKLDTVLPIVDKDEKFHGIYFKKDFRNINPAQHIGKPLVGIAIGTQETDLRRVQIAKKLGAGAIVIDSSHGDCPAVIQQTQKVKALVGHDCCVIAGNVASISGFLNLALAGADAVKCGIGSGSTCTTSPKTGVGVPMWTVIREISFLRHMIKTSKKHHQLHLPALIPDGGLFTSGQIVKALFAGGDAIMSGQMLAQAEESISAIENRCKQGDQVYYRGMASQGAINARHADRYGSQKSAPEGEEGYVTCQGPLKKWIGKEIELIQTGFAHKGARNIRDAQEIGNRPGTWYHLSNSGIFQNNSRV